MLQFVPISDDMLDDPELCRLALVPYQVGRLCHHGVVDGGVASNEPDSTVQRPEVSAEPHRK